MKAQSHSVAQALRIEAQTDSEIPESPLGTLLKRWDRRSSGKAIIKRLCQGISPFISTASRRDLLENYFLLVRPYLVTIT